MNKSDRNSGHLNKTSSPQLAHKSPKKSRQETTNVLQARSNSPCKKVYICSAESYEERYQKRKDITQTNAKEATEAV